MPLIRYFGFVGSVLVLLLIAIGWCFPQPIPNQPRTESEHPTIRISSDEQLPERVVIDTNLPTINPPPTSNDDQPTIALEPIYQRLDDAFAKLNISPSPAVPKAIVEVPKPKHIAKREPPKKVVAQRATQIQKSSPTRMEQNTTFATRMSLLETLKERLGQTLFKGD